MKPAIFLTVVSLTFAGTANAATQVGTVTNNGNSEQTINFIVPKGEQIFSASIISTFTQNSSFAGANLYVDTFLVHSFTSQSTYQAFLPDSYLDRLKDGKAIITLLLLNRDPRFPDLGSAVTTLRINSVAITSVPSIPEPSTWVMMLAGFGMVGAVARYRRRAIRAAYN